MNTAHMSAITAATNELHLAAHHGPCHVIPRPGRGGRYYRTRHAFWLPVNRILTNPDELSIHINRDPLERAAAAAHPHNVPLGLIFNIATSTPTAHLDARGGIHSAYITPDTLATLTAIGVTGSPLTRTARAIRLNLTSPHWAARLADGGATVEHVSIRTTHQPAPEIEDL